jgi:hypothetical protein
VIRRGKYGWSGVDPRWVWFWLAFAVLLGVVLGLGTADWIVVPR